MRYLMNITYDGSKFYGYQVQKNEKTIEGELEKTVSKIFNESINIIGTSRTDKGVHAINQYCHFDSDKNQFDYVNTYIGSSKAIDSVTRRYSYSFHRIN